MRRHPVSPEAKILAGLTGSATLTDRALEAGLALGFGSAEIPDPLAPKKKSFEETMREADGYGYGRR